MANNSNNQTQQIQSVQLPTSTLAIVSCCSSIIGLFLIPIMASIVGIVCGFTALHETRSSPPTKSGDVFAIVGIVVGIIGVIMWIVGFILLVAGIMVPSLCCFGLLGSLVNSMSTMRSY